MADLTVRTVESDDELRAASVVCRGALHLLPDSDEEWASGKHTYEPGRTLGAFLGDEMIGTAGSFTSTLAVPGGAVVPMAAVTRVGVRADRTRRGALSALMNQQLGGFAAAGIPVATLRASEAVIYGRFGYGVATRGRSMTIRHPAVLRPAPAPDGELRLVDLDEAQRVLPRIYARIGLRTGMIERPAVWWRTVLRRTADGPRLKYVVHHGPDGDDGFLVYRADHEVGGDGFRPALAVEDVHAADPAVGLALWRFVLRVDLVTQVRARLRPLDEPLDWLLTDRRGCETTGVGDETWLRLLDVPAALAARRFGDGPPVVIGVADGVLPDNSGRYRITADGVERTTDAAELSLDVAALGALYLGDVRPSTLATAGVITVQDPAAVARADRLFAATDVPWCGTFF